MNIIDISLNWTLQAGEPSNMPGMPAKTEAVDLPHDFMIGADVAESAKNGVNGGFYPGALMSYTKRLDIPETMREQRVLARFDGCAGLAKIVVNGHVAGRHHYGYTPFTVDMTPYLYYGAENRLTVTCGTDMEPNARWYTGGGLYRHVKLLTAPAVHLSPEPIFARLDHLVDGDAFVTVEVTAENHTGNDAIRWAELRLVPENGEGSRAAGRICVLIPAGKSAAARTTVRVENARIWDIESPELYKVRVELSDGQAVTDTAETLFGIRQITVDATYGLRLNGRSVKLRGGCIHADNGILGVASFYDSEYRKVKLHRDNGFNALRLAHNPASPELMEACDRLGMLVIDEAFDVWTMPKSAYDFGQFFEREWETELEAFIKRDRNHPCVLAWSVGNELPEQGGLSGGYMWSAKLTACIRALDPTRPVAGALCSFFHSLDDADSAEYWRSMLKSAASSGGSLSNLDSQFGKDIWNARTEAFCAPWDIVGYNYLNYHYDEAARLFPNRVLCATESKPREFAEYWADVEKHTYLIGDFEWTSHDYIGEAGIGRTMYVEPEDAERAARRIFFSPYPWRLAGSGDFDLCGFEKPQLHFKKIVWGENETYIAVHDPRNYGKAELLGRYAWPEVYHSWSLPAKPGDRVRVSVYSRGEEVELILNGESAGRGAVERFRADFEISWQPGTLEAVSYTAGKALSHDRLISGGVPAKLVLTAEKAELHADGDSLCFVRIDAADGDGAPIPFVEEKITAAVSGAARLVALGTGRPCTEENYQCGEIMLYRGSALAILRSGTAPGTAALKISSEKLGNAQIELSVQ